MYTKFPSIGGFHNVRKQIEGYVNSADYRGKIKLHGTNAGVCIRNGKVIAQGRERYLTPEEDNYKFAAWVEAQEHSWLTSKADEYKSKPITIFGEWCGSGIQKKVAISKIGRKVFCVFAVMIGDSVYDSHDEFLAMKMIVDPDEIAELVNVDHLPGVHILPWASDVIHIDFTDRDQMANEVIAINKVVEEVDQHDPWVKEVFDVDGVGEGIVYVPINKEFANRFHYSKLAFKAKGDGHKVNKKSDAVALDPVVVKSIEDFVDMSVTDARLEQGVRETNNGALVFDMESIGIFIGWVGKDVKKETVDELEAAGLEWKQVAKAVSTAARVWFIDQHNEH